MQHIDLSDRLNRIALMSAFGQGRQFCVWMTENGNTFVSAKDDVPEGAHVCFTAEAKTKTA